MIHNRKLRISSAGSRKAAIWQASEILWSEFTDKLKTPVRSTETMEQYLAYSKARQDDLKDVGGFVGGTLSGGRRKAVYVEGRDLITLDLDNIPAGQTSDIIKRVAGLGCAAAIYSTRKHTGYAPRLRVIIPLDRTASADEYEPVGRKLAFLIGIEFCDPTTFEAVRLMYWPSCCSNGEYIYEAFDNPFCSLDGILNTYENWQDVTTWPQVPGSDAIERRRLAKQEDPASKKGVIGAFCRTYSVTQALDKFIPGMYEETAMPNRYTYTGGSTVGGAVIYDGEMFLYSHHATDPCSGQLVNAFDLIRLHMYGDRDADAKDGTPVNKLPSFVAMSKLAVADKDVVDLIAKEKHEAAKAAFAAPQEEKIEEDNLEWVSSLEVDGNGNYRKTVNNIIIVLLNDPLLKGRVITDEFANRGITIGPVPWDQEPGMRQWTDVDDAGFFWYIENYYRMAQQDKLDRALAIVGKQNKINAVKQYLQGLKWDGIRRVDTLLPLYLGAEDNPYTRAVMRKFLCAAVARAVTGGVKFDYMPIFTGAQGIGKSTFLATLGKEWFSDSLTTFEGKDAAEMIQGTWINEIGELTAMTKQETSAVKQFLSKQEDIYRAAYGRRTDRYPRRCVFCGTSNEGDFLKDTTGNRRFWPVDVGIHEALKSVWNELPQEVDQIWAEAYAYWMLGEPLYLSKELEAMAAEQQEDHREASDKEGKIKDFLEQKIPKDWDSYDLPKRRMFWGGQIHGETELVERDKVCVSEIWIECFGGDMKYLKRTDSNDIAGIMRMLPGWQRNKSSRRYGPHGTQKGYERVSTKL